MKSFLGIGYKLFILISLCLATPVLAEQKSTKSEFKIGFGSCAKQDRPQLIWQKIHQQKPEFFIFAGDNVYIDSDQRDAMQQAYQKLASNPNFKKFRQSTPIVATWDDHDYGQRDGNKFFNGKQTAKEEFIRFWNYPEVNQLKQRPQGIFHTYWAKFNEKKIQVIMLDTRWYRDPMAFSDLDSTHRAKFSIGPYKPHIDPRKTLLGEVQWQWLAQELAKPADFRVIVSSIAVLAEHSGWDSWANYPLELNKLLDLLHPVNQGNNLVILSGDIHKAEISQRTHKGKTFTDVASSGLDAAIYPAPENQYRYGAPLIENNFGMLTLKDDGELSASVSVLNNHGKHKLTLSLGDD